MSLRNERKAIRLPSGDQTGRQSSKAFSVNFGIPLVTQGEGDLISCVAIDSVRFGQELLVSRASGKLHTGQQQNA
jgi:hypothetical protein